jgi:thiol-disulfide isomerase/thioredoxin
MTVMLAVTTGLAAVSSMPSMAAVPGSVAATFEVPGQNGTLKLSAYRGKLVYLDFWASWCGPCKHSFPWMHDMQARLGEQGLQIVAINLDAKHADAIDFLATMPANFVIGFDPAGAVAKSYGVLGMPSSVLIGPDGNVLAMHSGFNDSDKAELEKLITQNLPHATNK